MARLFGERALPSSVNQQRRRLRSRLQDLREPIRQRRLEVVPGPNVIDQIEDQVRQARSTFVERQTMVERIKERRSREGNSGQNSTGEEEQQSNRGRSGRQVNV